MTNSELIYPQRNLIKLAENICNAIFEKYSVEKLMNFVKKNRVNPLYIKVSREDPSSVKLIVDKDGKFKYNSNEPLVIPIPKKFAILEPDRQYFEMTLRANVFLAVFKANERELHK